MNRERKFSGNIKISNEEACFLGKAILRKYKILFPDEILILTTYPINYVGIKDSIYAVTKENVSEKTIIKLLLAKNKGNDLSFRHSVINAFYFYAHGIRREEFIKNKDNTFNPNWELFIKEFQQWQYSKYNYITTVQNFTQFYIIGIESNLTNEEYKFLLLSSVYYGHATFHYFINKLMGDKNTVSMLYEFAKINGGMRIKWRSGYLMSLFPTPVLQSFFSKIHDKDAEFNDAVIHHKVIEYLENLKNNNPSCSLYASQVLYQITNQDIFIQNHYFCI